MGANQKEAVAALHRERMLTAAEELFQQKGFEQTTIDDISKASPSLMVLTRKALSSRFLTC